MQHEDTIVRAATTADSAQLWRLAHLNGTRRLRWRYLALRQGGGGARARALLRHRALPLAA
jgi:hypothetical protein